MAIELRDFQGRMRILLELRGAVLTDEELSRMAASYPRCGGSGHWDVRQYARRTGIGAREYWVVRGSGTENVYRSAERIRAAAVGAALNELESQGTSSPPPLTSP